MVAEVAVGVSFAVDAAVAGRDIIVAYCAGFYFYLSEGQGIVGV
jgi:hypothetical protein